jgi:Ca-activated chloride channel family protein
MRRLVVIGVLATAAAGVTAQQAPTFRGGTDLVSIYATVMDRDGRLVTDLTRDDFEIRDNGRRQPLALFTNDLQPFSAVIMIDRSGSMASHFEVVRQAAGTFVRHLLPGDRLRIGSFGDDIMLSPATFESDRETLLAILREDLPDAGASSPVWDSIDRSIAALREEAGRRVVLVFSDGKNTGGAEPPLGVEEVIRRAQAHDVMVYAIGFSNTETYRPSQPARPPRRPPIVIPRPSPFPTPRRGLPVSQWGGQRPPARTRLVPPDPGLERLAAESGGGYFALETSVGLDAIFARVAEELHRQYWLGFTPTTHDGTLHRLEVKVRRSGLTVRARRDYLATF